MLHDGKGIVWLDGDVLRHGLNVDLSFSQKDRTENIRRTAEVARLLNASGALVISSLISPNAAQREVAREIIGPDRFIEVYVKASLDACESRDPHGLYARARTGDVANFTGVHSAYEPPENPRLILDTEKHSVEQCVEQLLAMLHAFS
jgi:adenylyl-sulfate kinase